MKEIKNKLNERGREIYDIFEELVKIKSVSNTGGVSEVGDYIYQYLKSLPYFQKNPHFLRKPELPDDDLGRVNILALVRGEKDESADTIVYLSHMDTVDTGEYGELEKAACNPEQLHKGLACWDLNKEVKADLESGEWVFGRGTADMKSGVALQIKLLEEFSRNVQELKGNIVLAVTVNEEADSLGIIHLARPLAELAEEETLNLLGVINTDYTTGEANAATDERYIYLGSMGKIVPAVYVVGKGSHVGQVFQGFDVNYILSRLSSRIDYNVELADRAHGLITNPPVSLKQVDLKDEYNGQLPYEGFAYYNFLSYTRGAGELLAAFKEEAEDCFQQCIEQININFKEYCRLKEESFKPVNFKPLVSTYQELYSEACEKLGTAAVEDNLSRCLEESKKEGIIDLRVHSLKMVRRLWQMTEKEGPAAVVFLVPPFYPPNNPDSGNPGFKRFNTLIKEFIEEKEGQITGLGYRLNIKPFFPYLSDASFCAYHGAEGDEEALINNMPFWGKGWEIDLENVNKINLPVADMGVYGKDAHKITERVHIPYTFNILPRLIEEVTEYLLEG